MKRTWTKDKTDQLRVRVTQEERQALERICRGKQDASTISDVVREGLAWYLNSDSQERPCKIPVETMRMVEQLAAELNRKPEQIIDECIRGIADQLVNDQLPLIVQEWKLRQDYRQQRSKGKRRLP